MKKYDIVFMGHFCKDEIIAHGQKPVRTAGSAVLYGGVAAGVTHSNIAAIVKMNPDDKALLQPLKDAGVEVYIVPAAETTEARVVYPSDDIEERHVRQIHNAGPLKIEELFPFRTKLLVLAGISNQEFDITFIQKLKSLGYTLAIDIQSFVRQIHPTTREIQFLDVTEKEKIVSLMQFIKLDVLEAKILTGTDDPAKAAQTVESWGCKEILITTSNGVLLRAGGTNSFTRFTHKRNLGRTGRGDTTFGAYLARRLTHPPREAQAWAAALASLKIQDPGPFSGSYDGVEKYLNNL
jgi:sugar/nucleoside kinase (ribokinase family)